MVRFIPRYFILFEAIVSGIVFLISLSVSSLLAYKNATDVWILILYSATLLNSFISSSSLLVGVLGFSIHNIISLANKDSFTSSFLIFMPVISFSCLIALAISSDKMLGRTLDSLFLVFRGKHLVFHCYA